MATQENDEIRAELMGAPRQFRALQQLAQEAHETISSSEDTIVFKHGDLVGEWVRTQPADGTGPKPTYYYEFRLPAVARFVTAE
jgi:hypothetical protein